MQDGPGPGAVGIKLCAGRGCDWLRRLVFRPPGLFFGGGKRHQNTRPSHVAAPADLEPPPKDWGFGIGVGLYRVMVLGSDWVGLGRSANLEIDPTHALHKSFVPAGPAHRASPFVLMR